METAKIFTNGGSQAVRLPRSCRFEQEEVLVNRIGSAVILLPQEDPWQTMMEGLSMFTEDFLTEEIVDLLPENRSLMPGLSV